MATKSRITNLSTRFLGFYKFSVAAFLAALIFYMIWNAITELRIKGRIAGFFFPLPYGYLFYVWFKVNASVHRVEFDDDFMIVILKGQDLLIPLENIKDVNLISLGGVYRVDLYSPELIGDKFYFKPSLLYPFNHKRKEAIIDILWSNIEKAKRKPAQDYRNTLHS